MCLFSKKDKEKIALLEQKIDTLESQIVNVLENYIVELNEKIETQNQIIQNLKAIMEYHIQNDMDMTEGDETEWEEN